MMTGTANATAVLSFGNNSGTKTATSSGTGTTLSTTSTVTPGSYIVNITTIGGTNLSPIQTIVAKETFGTTTPVTTVTSTGPATLSGNIISQPFTGTISYLDPSAVSPQGVAPGYLTLVFNGILTGTNGGLTADLKADTTVAGQSLVLTSNDSRVTPFINDPIRNFDISMGLNANTPLTITGTGATATIAGFTSVNESGVVNTFAVPEPASIVMTSTAVLAGLGCFGWRRARSKSL